jgi:hypothetical protein
MNRDRNLFGNLIVVMTAGADADYTQEIKGRLHDSIVLTPDIEKLCAGGKDWRNVATNIGLDKVTASHVLFLEQDLLVKDNFFHELIDKIGGLDAIGIFDSSNRFHPACLLTRKDILDRTSKDVGAYPQVQSDHFAKISYEIKSYGNWTSLQVLGLKDWYHLAGLTHNYSLTKDYYKPAEFYTYNFYCGMLEQPRAWKEFIQNKFPEMKTLPADMLDTNIAGYFDELI